MLKWKVEWHSGGFEVIEADDFEAATKKAIRIAKRRFLRVSALYMSKAD